MISDENLGNMLFKMNERRDLSEILLTRQEADEIILFLQELKQRRECELRPATKFIKRSLENQFEHIQQEFYEVFNARENRLKGCGDDQLIEELIDLQTSCETMIAMLGRDKNQRMEARRKVIAKNKARGYYDE